MTHRAETILEEINLTLTELDTTGRNVFRDRMSNFAEGELPGLNLFMGPDERVAVYSNHKMDWELTVFIDIKAKVTDTPLSRALLKIREEITAALQADITLGLSFVLNTEEQEVAAPELSQAGDSDQPIGTLRAPYKITYRRTRADAGAS